MSQEGGYVLMLLCSTVYCICKVYDTWKINVAPGFVLWLSNSYNCQADRASGNVCACVTPAIIFLSGYMHMHEGCVQSSHARVCLWHTSKIVFAAHSHMRERGAGDHFQCSTWRSINPIQTAPRRRPSNNLWWLRNLFMFVTVHWKINNLHNRSYITISARKHNKKTHTRNWCVWDKWKAN